MTKRTAILGGLSALGASLSWASSVHAGVAPHLSVTALPSSNGLGAIAWDRKQYKLTQFLEHPYASASASAQTRNFAYDSYPGVRIGGTGTWLNTVAPSLVEYVPGTGIIHTTRTVSGTQLDEYEFAPMGLAEHASVMLLHVTQGNAASAGAVDAYALFNYHLGTGSPSPGTDSESITYDAGRDAYVESGPSGVAMAYASLPASTHHGCTPNNPYGLLQAGSNLDDDASSGTVSDAVAGFQNSLGTLAAGASGWVGWVTVLAPDANGGAAADRVRAWVGGRSAAQLLSDEVSGWTAWIKAPPAGASDSEAALARQSQVLLRMGQVQESGAARGQILASIAPGQWNIAWVRDMAYAVVALARSGHYAEAKAGIAFQLAAQAGTYASQVGAPYQISVCRYYGNGTEWSDTNTDGPNVEFDGFGLFLWELDEYVRASGDTASLSQWWPAVSTRVADVLVGLQEPSGLVKADSSIWEVHWNGQQKHFAYTTIAAASGLCAASRLAQAAGDGMRQSSYLASGQRARDALLSKLVASSGALAQSTEAIAAGSALLDAAVIEAFDFGLIDSKSATAAATMGAIEKGLVPASGRGFMRSDAGDSYSSNEWVFVDLRAERALELQGDTSRQADLFSWNVAQATDNFGELSELHDPTTADYAGQSPMVGFGAGAYLLALYDRGTQVTPACGAFAGEPGGVDAGADGGPLPIDSGAPLPVEGGPSPSHDSGASADDAATPLDAAGGAFGDEDAAGGPSAPPGAAPSKGATGAGCGCTLVPPASDLSALAALAPLLLGGLRRRRS